ncbi:MAG TPA: ATP-binding protein, partial [Puia sp.]|nr:ATP-binding protein [Puia sp.]
MPIRKIVVIGPESTGKSTLCEGLAAHFRSDWVPEYAREYLLRHGKEYQFPDLMTIARGQLELEERHAAALVARKDDDPILFIDT